MININFRDPRPIYEQVRDGFIQLIVSGVLSPEGRMPSVRELSSTLTINPNTIQRAYRELEAAGYICSVPGKGSFVCPREETARARTDELTARYRELVRELRLMGVSDESLIAVIKEGERQ